MRYYPINLDIKGKKCLVVGGGRVAERKVKGLLEAGGEVLVVSPELSPGLMAMHGDGLFSWEKRGYRQDDVAGFFLIMAATDNQEVQNLVQLDAAEHRVLLNVADVPDKCHFILPAQVKRGDLNISISTGGKSPALAKQLRKFLESQIGSEFEVLTEIMGAVRPLVLAKGGAQPENERVFQQLLSPELQGWIKEKNWPRIKSHLERRLGGPLPVELAAKLEKLVLC